MFAYLHWLIIHIRTQKHMAESSVVVQTQPLRPQKLNTDVYNYNDTEWARAGQNGPVMMLWQVRKSSHFNPNWKIYHSGFSSRQTFKGAACCLITEGMSTCNSQVKDATEISSQLIITIIICEVIAWPSNTEAASWSILITSPWELISFSLVINWSLVPLNKTSGWITVGPCEMMVKSWWRALLNVMQIQIKSKN